MKKRKFKKSVFFIIIFIILLCMFLIMPIMTKNQKSNSKSKDVVNTKIDDENSKEKRLSIIAVGDVLIHESVYKDALNSDGTYSFHKMFVDVEDIIKRYDLKYCNQESTIGGKTLGITGYPSFNSPDEIGDEIVSLGFNLISLANNHALDRGERAIHYSNSYWKSKDVVAAGTYDSIEERDTINVYEKNGIRYAFLAYTTISNATPKNNYILNMYSADRAKQDIDSIKDKVDLIIVSMHWGVENGTNPNKPTESQRQIAEYLSGLGVNMIIGTHPHVVQPVEYIGDTLVIYSLGNFISNQLALGLNNGIGLMYGTDIVVDENGKVSFENEYKELVYAYANQYDNYNDNDNFKVIPFSKLNDNILSNYKTVEKEYMNIVNGEV